MAKKQSGAGVGIGLGLAAVAAAAAGAYFFLGKNAAKNRHHLKSWVVKAKGEVMENVEKLSDISEKSYDKTIDQVLAKYKKLKHVAPKELAEVKKELRSSWGVVRKELEKAAKKMKR